MPAGVLLVTAEPALASQVRRLCALAGSGCEVQRDSNAVRGAWREAFVVLVGSDLASAVAASPLRRREGIFIVTESAPDASCWNAALALGARRILTLPEDEAELVDQLRTAEQPERPRGRVIGVVGGCGGAGASTFACGLALTAAVADPSALIDADPLGGGLDLLLGAEAVPGLRWRDLTGTRGRLDPVAFAGALCQVSGVALLAWGSAHDGTTRMPGEEAIAAVVEATVRAFSTVVVDLCRRGGVADLFAEAVDATVVVVPAEVRAVAATASLMASRASVLPRPHLVVRETGGGLTSRDVAGSLGLELVASLREDPSVRAAGQRGELPLRPGRGALAQACAAVLACLAVPAGVR